MQAALIIFSQLGATYPAKAKGFIMLHYSVKLPMTLFFKVILIYAFAFKILGVSIHSLQVWQVGQRNAISSFPFVETIGL